MDIIQKIINDIKWESLLATGIKLLLILILTWVAMKIVNKILDRIEKQLTTKSAAEGEPPTESQKRIDTIMRLTKQAIMLVLWLVVGLMILNEIGVQIGPIIASAGIAGLAIGFGAQNLVRDFISGFFIILENQIRIGDVAVINGTGGLVEEINFRTTVLRDLGGIVHVFPNGTINTLSNVTNEWSAYVFDIGVAYKENTDKVIEIMRKVGSSMVEDEEYGKSMLGEPEIFGVDKFADSSVVIKGRIKTKPIKQWAVGREYLRRIKHAFDENDIEIPFPHLSLYTGEASKPLELELTEKFKKGEIKN
jgi:small conductance mechanosensitive channel